jgi:hypothetical protein
VKSNHDRAAQLTCWEGHDASPQITRMEGSIDAGERDDSETTLEFDVPFSFLQLLGLFEAIRHDLSEHLLDLLHRKRFHRLSSQVLVSRDVIVRVL